jgi:galactokinase
VHVDGEEQARLRVGTTDRGDDHGVEQGGERAAVNDAARLQEVVAEGEAHAGVVGADLFEDDADEAGKARSVDGVELFPDLGALGWQRRKAIGVHSSREHSGWTRYCQARAVVESRAVSHRLVVPGRLCLLGEHADWAGAYGRSPGYCLVAGTDQRLVGEVARADGVVELTSGADSVRLPADGRALDAAARAGGFFSYAAGVAAEVMERHGVGGLRVHVVDADLPVCKGLSSSAAICVLVARAYNTVYALGLSVEEEMDLAYRGERRAGSECGRMDQVCALGRGPFLLTFDGARFEIEPVMPGAACWLLIVDLRRGKDTRRILADLNACFPDAPGTVARAVREALGPRNAALVGAARRAVEAGDARRLGELMTRAQAVFDAEVAPACPSELAAPRLHAVLAHPAGRELAWGGKGVGSQGDGCAQLVARGPAERDALAARLTRELDVVCLPLTIGGAG